MKENMYDIFQDSFILKSIKNAPINLKLGEKQGQNEDEKKQVIYLRVLADMNPNRSILPQKVMWNDGREFQIEKVTNIRREMVEELGELCLQYYCLIDGKFRILCLNDDMKWFTMK